MTGIKLYGGRHNPGRAGCAERYRHRKEGTEIPLELYNLNECLEKAGLP